MTIGNTTRIGTASLLAFAFAVAAQAQAPASPPPAPAAEAAPAAAPAKPPATGSVDKLPWLTGCWQGKIERDGSMVYETWFAPRGGTLMGVSQTLRDGKTGAWEAMRMYDDGDAMKLWVRPGARGEVTFSLDSAGVNFVEFAAVEGPVTTKLRYERKSETEVLATLRFIQGESRRGADFLFGRIECSQLFTASSKDAPAK